MSYRETEIKKKKPINISYIHVCNLLICVELENKFILLTYYTLRNIVIRAHLSNGVFNKNLIKNRKCHNIKHIPTVTNVPFFFARWYLCVNF